MRPSSQQDKLWTPEHGISFSKPVGESSRRADDPQHQTWLQWATQQLPAVPSMIQRTETIDSSRTAEQPRTLRSPDDYLGPNMRGSIATNSRHLSRATQSTPSRAFSTTSIGRASRTAEEDLSDVEFSPSSPEHSEYEAESQESYIFDGDVDCASSHPSDRTSAVDSAVEQRAEDVLATAVVQLQHLELVDDDSEAGAAEQPTKRTYSIPDKTMKEALDASEDSDDRFWTFRMYRNSEDKKPLVHYCKDLESAETWAAEFVDEPVLGFDLEWEIQDNTPSKTNIKRAVSVLQLASESRIAIFHFAMFEGDTPDQFMPSNLRKILLAPGQIKAGVNVTGDARRVKECFDIDMRGVFELSHIYKQVKFGATQPLLVNKTLVSLATQVETVLGLPLAKGEVRTGAWSRKLSLAQSDYAASDAYAGFQLFLTLDEQRMQMDPAPPRPAFYELRQPIPLPDGSLSDNDSESEADSDDPQQASESKSATRRKRRSASQQDDTSAQTDDTSPRTDDQDGQTEDVTLPVTTPARVSSRATTRVSSPVFDQANTWASSFRASLADKERKLVGDSELRAYHIWHVQEHDLATTAGIMRSPPLALSTVAGYVCRSVYHCNLPADADRLEQLTSHLTIYDKRYGRVVTIARLNE